jgi:hypothetical protein
MSITTVETTQRITCDNPDCNVYLDELIRLEGSPAVAKQDPQAMVPAKAAALGWSHRSGLDFCPEHPDRGQG